MPDWAYQALAILGSGAAVYAGIRVDLALAKATAERAEKRADDAHVRIDKALSSKRVNA